MDFRHRAGPLLRTAGRASSEIRGRAPCKDAGRAARNASLLSVPQDSIFRKKTKIIFKNIMGAPDGYNRKEIVHRIGTFFLMVGIGLFVFFILSEAAKEVAFDYFCWGVLIMIIGFVFRGQFRRTTAPSGRFS